MARRELASILVLMALVAPSGGTAATARVDGARVVFQAQPGEANRVQAVVIQTGVWPQIASIVALRDDGARIAPRTGCVAVVAPAEVVCRLDEVWAPRGGIPIKLELGDRHDVVLPPICHLACRVEAAGAGGDDRIEGGAGADDLAGGAGDDLLSGGSGRLCGSGGYAGCIGDVLRGHGGNDTLLGGPDLDSLNGGPGTDILRGGPGHDRAWDYLNRGAPVRVTLDGIANDGPRGERDNLARDIEAVEGGNRADVMIGNSRENAFDGRGGNDRLYGRAAGDCLQGGGGSDSVRAGAGRDRVLVQDGRRDAIDGGGGRDRAHVDRRVDSLRGIERLLAGRLYRCW